MEPFCTAILCKNERFRYLPEVLDWHGQWGPIVVLDDHSDDGTFEYCQSHPSVVTVARTLSATEAWGQESPAREQLWNLAADHADWILVCDADQLLSADPRQLCASTVLNGWAWPLYDLWDDRGYYREDQFWRGHLFPRPWLFRPRHVPDGYVARWSRRGIHTGHTPANFPLVAQVAPEAYYWTHLAYLDQKDREAKLTKYRSQYHQMTDFEKAHAESIADKDPPLKVLPFAKPVRILVGGPVRKRKEILDAHLASLEALELPDRVKLTFCFVDDYPNDDPARESLVEFVNGRGMVIKSTDTRSDDFSDTHPVTHQWTLTAMDRMGRLKSLIFRECLKGNYDYVWLIDSDLIVDKTTLRSMYALQKPVVSAVYWTRWNNDPRIHAGPQVWLKPPYQLSLPHYPEHEFRHKLGVARETEKVAGLGACTLIARGVIEKGVNFSKPEGFPDGGLWDGEDRHFCEWARRLHVEMWADGWPDIAHIYHPQQIEQCQGWLMELTTDHPQFCNTGHLVSLRLTNIEDAVGPMSVRCRIGDGTLLPEIETHLLQMRRGDSKVVRIHFPSTTRPIPARGGVIALAGQNRLIQVELLDCKPFVLPPVLRDEFYYSAQAQDMTHLTADQHAKIGERA